MQKIIDSGIYVLILFSSNEFYIKHKSFLNYKFVKGYYYYIGSSQKNYESRIKRHLAKEKKVKWHIDYLTTNQNIKVIEVISFEKKQKEYECQLSNFICKYLKDIELVTNFGNSDCKICKTHLYFSKKNHIKQLETLKIQEK